MNGGSLQGNPAKLGETHRQLKSAKNDAFRGTVYLQNYTRTGLSSPGYSHDDKLRSNKVLQFINGESCSEQALIQ